MKYEMTSMKVNQVWELVELPNGFTLIQCKWVCKTKRNSKGNINRYKTRFVAKGFTLREDIDYNETFFPALKKDLFRIFLALVTHYDLELYQMDVKTTFLNGNLDENIYMRQPKGFEEKGKEHLVCKLWKSIYGLKQASRQWYIKFHNTITTFGFQENKFDECVYLKVRGSKFILLMLYVDDILLATNNLALLHETKSFLSKNFEMKDMGNASFVLGIEIYQDRCQCLIGLSQMAYINKVLERFQIQKRSPILAPIVKGNKFTTAKNKSNAIFLGALGKTSLFSFLWINVGAC